MHGANVKTLMRGLFATIMSAICPSEDMIMESSIEFSEYLRRARRFATQAEIAKHMGCSARQVRRWEIGESTPPVYAVDHLRQLPLFSNREADESQAFSFIDLFAGIGGIRLGFDQQGGRCVFTSEWDRFSQKTYAANFCSDEAVAGDITNVAVDSIPSHDVLLAGFPCQPFSIAGVSKKQSLGRQHGFLCEAQGTLFFDVARIISAKRPKAFLLENVKNLVSHDKGKTFAVITRILREELGYDVHWKIIDAKHFLPQHRERIVIVGFREPMPWDWSMLALPEKGRMRLDTVLHSEDCSDATDGDVASGYILNGRVNPKYTLSDKLWSYLQNYAEGHRSKGNGFGFGLVSRNDTARTLSARYYKDGSEILVSQGSDMNPRRLTPRECARLMGFPESFNIPVSDTQAYRQFGNSVAVPVIAEVARVMGQFVTSESPQPQLPLLMS